MLRTVADQPTLWEAILPNKLRRLPEELRRVDGLLNDPAFFTPFIPFFDPRVGRPSTPMETYLRLMFLKFRYRLGYESSCREVSDSITWRQFCRIGLDQPVPHPMTLMKLTTRCGSAAVEGLNQTLLAKAVQAKLLRCTRVRVDTTVVPSNLAYPTDSGLLAKAVNRIAATGRRIRAAGGAVRTKLRDRSRAAGRRAVNDFTELLEATRRVVEQTRQRLAGQIPDGATRQVSLHDPDARPIRKGRLGSRSSSVTRPNSSTTTRGSCWTTTCSPAILPTGPG